MYINSAERLVFKIKKQVKVFLLKMKLDFLWCGSLGRSVKPHSDEYLNIYNSVIDGDIEKSLAMQKIVEAFHQYNVNVSRLPKTWLDGFLDIGRLRFKGSRDGYCDFVELTRDLDYRLMTSYEWLEVYSLLLRLGMFKVGYFFRQNAVLICANEIYIVNSDSGKLKRKFAAYIELERDSEAKNLLEKNYKYLNVEEYGYSLFLLNSSPNEGKVDEFQTYLLGKSISIVSPVPVSAFDANEIDSCDCVVRFNYKGYGAGCDSKHKGLKTDLSYFNGSQIEYMLENGCKIPDDIDWAIVKTKGFLKELAHHCELKLRPKFRKTHDASPVLFNGWLNAVPFAIFDLVFSGAKKVKIFHSDLMLTKGRTTEYYPDTLYYQNNEISRFLASMTVHDPVTQFRFLSLMFRQGVIKGDEMFEGVMEMTCEQYMDKLDLLYGNV